MNFVFRGPATPFWFIVEGRECCPLSSRNTLVIPGGGVPAAVVSPSSRGGTVSHEGGGRSARKNRGGLTLLL